MPPPLATFPAFEDPTLNAIANAFARRRKALRYKAGLETEHGTFEDGGEWFSLYGGLSADRTLILELASGEASNIYLTSNARADRRRRIVRFEGIWLIPNGVRIVQAFEASLSMR